MKLVKRWNTQLNVWELGYWYGTQFHIVGHVKLVA